MMRAEGIYGGWEIDTEGKRLRWLGLHEGVVLPAFLHREMDANGVPRCEAERTGEDGWAPYDEILKCEVGEPFIVRWVDKAIMFVPTRLTTVEGA